MVLPYIRAFANQFDSKVHLFSVPEGSESEGYNEKIKKYLDGVATTLKEEGLNIDSDVSGYGPARTILAESMEEKIDLIMMSSHGRGGVDRSDQIPIGSVALKVIEETMYPLFLLPLHREDMIGRESIETTETSETGDEHNSEK